MKIKEKNYDELLDKLAQYSRIQYLHGKFIFYNEVNDSCDLALSHESDYILTALFEWLDENIECDDDMMIGHNVIYPTEIIIGLLKTYAVKTPCVDITLEGLE